MSTTSIPERVSSLDCAVLRARAIQAAKEKDETPIKANVKLAYEQYKDVFPLLRISDDGLFLELCGYYFWPTVSGWGVSEDGTTYTKKHMALVDGDGWYISDMTSLGAFFLRQENTSTAARLSDICLSWSNKTTLSLLPSG